MSRNHHHDEAIRQDLVNMLGLTHAAADLEVQAASAQAVADMVELSNQFRTLLGQWREQLAQFRARASAAVADSADTPSQTAAAIAAAASPPSVGDPPSIVTLPADATPDAPEPATAVTIAVGDTTAKS